jgi:hypothetical protein
MKLLSSNLIVLYIIICLSGCTESRKKPVDKGETEVTVHDSLSINLIADTIIYDVIIKNTDPNNEWTEKCLGKLDRNTLIDQLFESVYNKQATAYNFFTGKELKPAQLKRIERDKDFDRSNIGKLQFTEEWYYDPSNIVMQKKILSITLGYELQGNDNRIIGYKPVFKIELN